MKTILIADDEPNLRLLVRTMIEDADCQILEAENGLVALVLARGKNPDLILLDWMMPGMDGIEVLKALRQDPATANIPVIMLTAKGQKKDQDQALALGTQSFLLKPFSPLELFEKVKEVMGSLNQETQEP